MRYHGLGNITTSKKKQLLLFSVAEDIVHTSFSEWQQALFRKDVEALWLISFHRWQNHICCCGQSA